MKASAEQQRRLLDLQQIDTRLGQVAHREKHLPESAELAALDQQRIPLRESLQAVRSVYELTQAELSRLEDDAALVRTRSERTRSRLAQSTAAKEAMSFETELESLARRSDELDEILLVVMERAESEEAAVSAAAALLTEVDARAEQLEQARDLALQAAQAERAELLDERTSIRATIEDSLYELYEETRQRYGIGAALIRRRISEGSNMALTESDLANIRETPLDELVFCRDSGAILVRTEESGL